MEKKKLAVLVGCNYPNTPNELHGCINDVVAMRDVLVTRFGLDPSHIELLTDAQGSLIMPTGANIKRALHEMVDKAEPGDVLFFHYSGHGTRIPSLNHDHHHSGKDEAIVPCDFNLITGKLTRLLGVNLHAQVVKSGLRYKMYIYIPNIYQVTKYMPCWHLQPF